MSQPLLSIVIPIYNGAEFIPKCIDSIYEQGLAETDFEVICVDDCSTDSTPQVLASLAAQHKNLSVLRHSVNKRQGGGGTQVSALRTGSTSSTSIATIILCPAYCLNWLLN